MAVDNETDIAHSRCHANDSSERHALFYVHDSLYDFFDWFISNLETKRRGPRPKLSADSDMKLCAAVE